MNTRKVKLLNSILCSPLRQLVPTSRIPHDRNPWICYPRGCRKSLSSGSSPVRTPGSGRRSSPFTNIQYLRSVRSRSDDTGKREPPKTTTSEHGDHIGIEGVSTRIDGLVSKITERSRRILNNWTGYALVESLNKATEEQSRPSTICRHCCLSSLSL